MLHLFALIVLLTPPSQAKATVTNTTLFDIHLHGNTHELDKIKDMALRDVEQRHRIQAWSEAPQ